LISPMFKAAAAHGGGEPPGVGNDYLHLQKFAE
jgi:hypothetical protein